MGLRPMLSAMMRNKTGPVLVALQIAVTLAVVINALFIISQRAEKMNRETGIDVPNVITFIVRGFGEDFDVVDSIRNDIDLLQSIPGVVAATVSNQVPLSGSGSGTGLRTVADENIDAVPAARYRFSEQGLDALGVELARGRNFLPEEVNYIRPTDSVGAPPSVIVTQALADELFPEDDALGKPVYWGSMEPSTIVGIIGHMHGSWVNWDKLGNVVLQPGKPAYSFNRYIVRVEDGLRDQLMPQLEDALAKSNRRRVINEVRSLEELAVRSYRRDRGMIVVLTVVVSLLISMTALVVVGLTSYHVTQRRRQIGIRRALGATRTQVLRDFVVENWLVTLVGSLLGGVLTVAVAYWLESAFSLPRLDWRFLPAGIGVLWLLSTFAAIVPARRASLVPPAVATRSI